MDQISLQTLDHVSIDIRRTLLHLSDLLILPPDSTTIKAHIYMAAQSVNLRFVVHIPSPNPVISHACTCVCDVLLENSSVIGIHQKSAKYRELLLLYSLTFAGMRLSVGANIYGDGYVQGNYTVSENVYFHDNLLYIENQYTIPNLFANLRFLHSWQYYVCNSF